MVRGFERSAGRSLFTLIRKNAYLVTLALVSPTRNSRSRAQTSIFTIENQHFLIQMAPQPSWPPSLPADCLQANNPQPGILGQGSSAKHPQQVIPEHSLKVSFEGLLPALESYFEKVPCGCKKTHTAWGLALESFNHFKNISVALAIPLQYSALVVSC